MYLVENIRKRGKKSYSYTYLAESYRDGKKCRRRMLANLSKLPERTITTIRNSINGATDLIKRSDVSVETSIDYGYFFVIWEILKRLRIQEVMEKVYPEGAKLAQLIIIGKIITRGSKLSIANWIKRNPQLAIEVGMEADQIKELTEKKLYAVQEDLDKLERKLGRKWFMYHKKKHETIYLYDITSFYFEGNQNELSGYGYDRDKKGKPIITVGLITDQEGFPLRIQVRRGVVQDQQTVTEELNTLKQEFDCQEIIFVGDRGMKIRYNLEKMTEQEKAGINYISGLTVDEIRGLEKEGIIQLSLFDKEIVEIEYQDKRYLLCNNPVLAEEKRKSRQQKKGKYEMELAAIQQAYQKVKERCKQNRKKLKQGDKNKKLKVKFTDKELNSYRYRERKFKEKYKMQKIYTVTITRGKFTINYDAAAYARQESYDGKYVMETTVKKEQLNKEEVVETYKRLQNVEHIFRDMKLTRLNVRPIFHRKASQTRAHIMISMMAYAIIHEMESRVFPWLRERPQDKQSFNDVIEEMKLIKLCKLSLGKGSDDIQIQITKLTKTQKQIMNLLDLKSSVLASVVPN